MHCVRHDSKAPEKANTEYKGALTKTIDDEMCIKVFS